MKIWIFVCCLAAVYSEPDDKVYTNPLTYICDFESNECGFHGNTTSNEWNKVASQNGDPNHYLVAEAMDTLDKTKMVFTSCYSVTSPEICLSFRYFVKGSDDVKLVVQQKGGDNYQKWESKKETVNKGWTKVKFDVSLLPLQSKAQVFGSLNSAINLVHGKFNGQFIQDQIVRGVKCNQLAGNL